MTGEVGHLVNGRYRLDGLIGRGGMGRVWRGHDGNLDRAVAVKELIIPVDLPEDERDMLVARALREARVAARLRHESVIGVHDVVLDDAIPWIVMELVTGASLAEEIRRDGALDWRRVARIGAAMADALAHAHGAGVVHRDLKPENVLLAGDRTVIADFGIARVLDATTQLTRTGMAIGTPYFMAPEQLEGHEATAASDLWSLGATLYTAVEGRRPFDAPTLTALYVSILTQPPAPTEQAGPLAAVLERLLVKDPAARPDAAAAADLLRALADGGSAPPMPTVLLHPTAPTMVSDYPAKEVHQLFTCREGQIIRRAWLVPVRRLGQPALALCIQGTDQLDGSWAAVEIHNMAEPSLNWIVTGVLTSRGDLVPHHAGALQRLMFIQRDQRANAKQSLIGVDLSHPEPNLISVLSIPQSRALYTTGVYFRHKDKFGLAIGGRQTPPMVLGGSVRWLMRRLRGDLSPAHMLATADGVVVGWDATGAIAWDVTNGRVLHQFRDGVIRAAASPNGNLIALDGPPGVTINEPRSGKEVARLPRLDNASGLGLALLDTPQGGILVAHVTEQAVRVWQPTSRKVVAELPPVGEEILATAMIPVGARIAVVVATPQRVAAMMMPEPSDSWPR